MNLNFPNAYSGLFTGWMHDINAEDLGNATSGGLSYVPKDFSCNQPQGGSLDVLASAFI